MSSTWRRRSGWVLLLTLVAVGGVAQAEEVEKRWRLGMDVGGYSTQGKVPSDAPNVLFVLDYQLNLQQTVRDPRNEAVALGDLKIKSAPRVQFNAQYALTRTFLIEGSVGYQRADVGDVEAQVQYTGLLTPQLEGVFFDFDVFRIPVGEVEQIPLQLSAIMRFRPRSNFNPYVGAGLGYMFVGFTPSDEFNDLSQRLDANQGSFAFLRSSGRDFWDLFWRDRYELEGEDPRDMGGATVDADDTFEWHLLGGAEYTFARKWSFYLDLRYYWMSRAFRVQFDGRDQLGVSVPNLTVSYDSPEADVSRYGGYELPYDGIFDGGRLVPYGTQDRANVPMDEWQSWCTQPGMLLGGQTSGTELPDCVFASSPVPSDPSVPQDQWAQYCDSQPDQCFDPMDGQTDPGIYYLRGGKINYGGFSVSLGVRYTF